jgi:importin subunit alpha-6/7
MPPADRRAAYKNTLDKDDARRGREETTISLRKDKRQEQLQKKRFGQGGAAAVGGAAGMATPEQTSVGSQAWAESDPQKLVAGVHSDDPNLQLPAVTQFRKLLSIERSPPIEEVIAAGVVPRFVQFLQAHAPPLVRSSPRRRACACCAARPS